MYHACCYEKEKLISRFLQLGEVVDSVVRSHSTLALA